VSKIIFYTNPMSRGQIARWALHEAGAEYEQVLLEYGETGKGGMKSPEYLAVNSLGKVPAIVDGEHVVTECAVICAYLAVRFADKGLAPKNAELANYYRWMFFGAGPLESAVTNKALGFEVSADKEKMAGYGNYDRVIDARAAHFDANDYVCGDRFTMADVYIGAHVVWGQEFGTVTPKPSFSAYAERLTQREAYGAAKEIDAKLIAAARPPVTVGIS
jgi:glutathione S-transferase